MAQYSLNYEQPEPEQRREFVSRHRITGKAIYKVYDQNGHFIIQDEDGEKIETVLPHGVGQRLSYAPDYGSARFIDPDDHDPISTMQAFRQRQPQFGSDINRYIEKISKSQLLTKAFQSMIIAGLRINDEGQILWDNETMNAPGQLGLKLFQEFDRLKNISNPDSDLFGINDRNPS